MSVVLRDIRQWRILGHALIETPIFTRLVAELFADDDEYRCLQLTLLVRPRAGVVIPKSGGLRKARWGQKGKGKRGGCRIIYFFDESSETFYMLYGYAKTAKEDLTPQQLRILSRLVREEFA